MGRKNMSLAVLPPFRNIAAIRLVAYTRHFEDILKVASLTGNLASANYSINKELHLLVIFIADQNVIVNLLLVIYHSRFNFIDLIDKLFKSMSFIILVCV